MKLKLIYLIVKQKFKKFNNGSPTVIQIRLDLIH